MNPTVVEAAARLDDPRHQFVAIRDPREPSREGTIPRAAKA